jgi:hypothetical protein
MFKIKEIWKWLTEVEKPSVITHIQPVHDNKKYDLLFHYSDSAAGWKYQGIVIVFRGETRGVSLCDSVLTILMGYQVFSYVTPCQQVAYIVKDVFRNKRNKKGLGLLPYFSSQNQTCS